MELSVAQRASRAPGCYASPSVFSRDSRVCKGCSAFEDCGKDCIETLQALRQSINVADLLKRHTNAMASVSEPAVPAAKVDTAKFLPSPKMPTTKVKHKPAADRKPQKYAVDEADLAIAESLNDKPGKEALRLCKNGMMSVMRAELPAGRNPFTQTQPCFMQVTCQQFLNGPVTKHSLRDAFVKQLGRKEPWGIATATSHVNIALQLLEGYAFITEASGTYQLVRNNE